MGRAGRARRGRARIPRAQESRSPRRLPIQLARWRPRPRARLSDGLRPVLVLMLRFSLRFAVVSSGLLLLAAAPQTVDGTIRGRVQVDAVPRSGGRPAIGEL